MAEAMYRRFAPEHQLKVESRGLVVLFPEPANAKACVVMQNNELPLNEHTSQPLTEEDLDDHTLVLTMTEKQKQTIIDTYGDQYEVYAIKEYLGMEGDVVDPYGGSLLDYEACFSELSSLVKKVVYKIDEEEHI